MAKTKDMTGPELNIGPELNRGNKEYNAIVRDIAEYNKEYNPTSRYGTTTESVSKHFDTIEKATNKAKAKADSTKYSPKYKKGGSVKSSASKRADGCAQRGKTKGRMV